MNADMQEEKIAWFKLFFLVLIFSGILSCQKDDGGEGDPIVLTYSVTELSDYATKDGAIDLTVSGGVKPYGFFWSNGETTEDIDSLEAGSYVIIVTDKEHQIKVDTVDVLQPDPDSMIVTYVVTYPTTNEGSDGSIDLTVTDGYPPYSFLWSNGSQTEDISGLSADVYIITVTDSLGVVFRDTISLLDFIVDIDGNGYGTVTIGGQTWMKQNLRVTHTAQGESIESYVYNGNNKLAQSYGRLYAWEALMNGSTENGTQGICPDGWHIPTDEEFKTLEKTLGMSAEEADLGNVWRGENIGTKLKFGGSSDFDALLSGRRDENGTFSYLERYEYLWTSTTSGSNKAWRRSLDKEATTVGRFDSSPKTHAFSVRCIKNDE